MKGRCEGEGMHVSINTFGGGVWRFLSSTSERVTSRREEMRCSKGRAPSRLPGKLLRSAGGST
jgi:hypothetical protein